MSLLDTLLGRDNTVTSKPDQLFALTTSAVTMRTALDMTPTNHGAISFRPVSTGDWRDLEKEMADLLDVSRRDSPLKWRWFTDEYEFRWVILHAGEFENLVATVAMIGAELADHGYGDQLLATVVQFKDASEHVVYLIYNYKRGAFYPFVPDPNRSQERLNAVEFRISGALGKELPMEKEVESWYALWGVPI